MSEPMSRPVPEFDCCECGRHVLIFGGTIPTPPLCGACQMIPGWFRVPALRERIDRDHDGRDPADQVPA